MDLLTPIFMRLSCSFVRMILVRAKIKSIYMTVKNISKRIEGEEAEEGQVTGGGDECIKHHLAGGERNFGYF